MPERDHAAPGSQLKSSDLDVTRGAAIEVARLLSDDKCEEVVVLDVTGISQVCDFMVIASGTSDRQMRSAGDNSAELTESLGFPVYRRSVDDRTTWVVLDCVDVVVHIFEPNTRAHYDLEMLWGDAPRVEWERPASAGARGSARDHAGLEKTRRMPGRRAPEG